MNWTLHRLEGAKEDAEKMKEFKNYFIRLMAGEKIQDDPEHALKMLSHLLDFEVVINEVKRQLQEPE